jgi:hypothetical protein
VLRAPKADDSVLQYHTDAHGNVRPLEDALLRQAAHGAHAAESVRPLPPFCVVLKPLIIPLPASDPLVDIRIRWRLLDSRGSCGEGPGRPVLSISLPATVFVLPL